MRFVISLTLAVLLAAPLLMAQVALLLLRFQDWWPHESKLAITLDEVLNMPLLLAYYYLWTPVGIIYLLLCLSATGFAWRAQPTSWGMRLLLMLVSVVTLLGVGFDIWWYLTGQVFHPLT
jgi:hypothetical protein